MAHGKKQKIEQLDFDTGEVVGTYNSITEASKDNWVERDYLTRMLRKGNDEAVFDKKKLLFRRVTE
ncbi:MAG: hypothetical protein PHG19_04075 [Anaerotignum sp.]|nr:hypothetical protein [Anaerotignum sp.]